VNRPAAGFLALALLLAACAPAPLRPPAGESRPSAAPGAEADEYAAAARRGERVYRVDGAASVVVIEVRRAGSLAQFGHDHVVASRSARGHVDATRRRADVRFRLDELTVDEPALRDQAGFTTRPSAEDIAGTRANMLERVLESDRYAEAAVHVESREGGPLTVTLTLHGIAREIDVPVAVEVSDDAVEASGRCELRLSDFGMAPFAILGGAIRVDDTVVVRFRIRATRLAG
jgi:hypothetical protein